VSPLRTVGGRLALALLVVVGGSLAIVYLIVVQSYRGSLVDSRLDDLRHRIEKIAAKPRDAPGEVFPSTTWIEDEALQPEPMLVGPIRPAIRPATLPANSTVR
jgi:hypothetical protein